MVNDQDDLDSFAHDRDERREERRPERPHGSGFQPRDQRLDFCGKGLDLRRQLLPLEARGQIAAQRVELDFQRPNCWGLRPSR